MLNWCYEPGYRIEKQAGTNWAYSTYYTYTIPLHGGSYRMYLSASNDGASNWTISAVSPDGLNFCMDAGIRVYPVAGSDYSVNIMFPVVVPLDGGGYRMYLSGWKGGYNSFQILSAISSDGLNFTMEPGRRIGRSSEGRLYPRDYVMLPNGCMRLYYLQTDLVSGGKYWLSSAISPDGLNFTEEPGKRLESQTGTAWDTHTAHCAVAELPGGGYRIFFTAQKISPPPTVSYLRSAIFPDGLNFTIEPGQRQGITDVWSPDLVKIPGGYRLYHSFQYDGPYIRSIVFPD